MMISVYSQDAILTVRTFRFYFSPGVRIHLFAIPIPDVNDISKRRRTVSRMYLAECVPEY